MIQSKNTNYLPTLSGLIISACLLVFITYNIFNYGTAFDTRIIVTSFTIFLVWLVSFILTIRRTSINIKSLLISIFLLAILSLFLVRVIWFSGYLSLDPYTQLVEGKTHIDTMFHSTLARTYYEYGETSILANGIHEIKYHTGSHVILGAVSLLTNIHIVFVYCFIYPMIFLPLFFVLIQHVAFKLKYFLSSIKTLNNIDLFFIILFFIPLFNPSVYSNSGIWIENYFVSESFLVANTFLLLFFNLFIFLKQKEFFKSYLIKRVWYLVGIPLGFTLISYCKISTGAILLCGIGYINFRKNTSSIKHWILNLWYATIFLIYYFGIIGGSTGETSSIELFSFAKERISTGNYLFHILFFSFFTLTTALYKMWNLHILSDLIKNKTNIIEESLIIVTVIAFLPGLVLYIPGGSAAYFTMVTPVIGIVFFIAYEIPQTIVNLCKKGIMTQIATKLLVLLLCFTFIININVVGLARSFLRRIMLSENYVQANYEAAKQDIKNGNVVNGSLDIAKIALFNSTTISNNIVKNLKYLNSLPATQKKQAVVFIDDTCELWKKYNDGDTILFLISAYTGIQTYNLLFLNHEKIPTYQNSTQSLRYRKGYALMNIPLLEKKLLIEEAVIQAQTEGYKHLYYYSGDAVEEMML